MEGKGIECSNQAGLSEAQFNITEASCFIYLKRNKIRSPHLMLICHRASFFACFLPHELITSSSTLCSVTNDTKNCHRRANFPSIPSCGWKESSEIRFRPRTFQLAQNKQQQIFSIPVMTLRINCRHFSAFPFSCFWLWFSLSNRLCDDSTTSHSSISQNYLILTSPSFHNSSRNSLMSSQRSSDGDKLTPSQTYSSQWGPLGLDGRTFTRTTCRKDYLFIWKHKKEINK